MNPIASAVLQHTELTLALAAARIEPPAAERWFSHLSLRQGYGVSIATINDGLAAVAWCELRRFGLSAADIATAEAAGVGAVALLRSVLEQPAQPAPTLEQP